MKKHIISAVLILAFTTAVGYLVLRIQVIKSVKEEITHVVGKTSAIQELSYDGLDIDLFRFRITLNNLKILPAGHEDHIRVDALRVLEIDRKSNFPAHMHMVMEGIHFDPAHPLFTDLGPIFQTAGYDRMVARIGISYRYDPDQAKIDIRSFSVGARDVGRIYMTAKLSNFHIPEAFGDDAVNLARVALALPAVSLETAVLTFENETLVQGLIRRNAELKGQSTEDYREAAIQRYRSLFKAQGAKAIRKEFGILEAFIRDPDRITAIVAPPEPVPFLKLLFMKGIPNLITRLNISLALTDPGEEGLS